jgi:ankyrin repeat protein
MSVAAGIWLMIRTPELAMIIKASHDVHFFDITSEGVDADSRDTYGQTPLSRAAWRGHDAASMGYS